MKKKILLGLFSVLFLLPIGVSAETLSSINPENNSSDASVTVGEVEVPVYNVEIDWNSFKFDWKYNHETNKYEWQVGTSVDTGIEQYTNHFHISDLSTGGEIVPSVKWTSEEDYDYVEGLFRYEKVIEECKLIENKNDFDLLIDNSKSVYTNATCTNETYDLEFKEGFYAIVSRTEIADLTTSKIPEDGRVWGSSDSGRNGPGSYHLKLYLKNKTQPTETPKAGEKIGTITITIEAAE